MFLQQVDLDYYFEWCKEAYHVSPAEVLEQVDFTNAYYGGDNPRGSRVIFVDGKLCIAVKPDNKSVVASGSRQEGENTLFETLK